MGWADTWSDILSGGAQRWKVTSEESHQKALSLFQQYVKGNPSETSVYCPLAGDDPMVHLLFTQGYSVTTIDLVPAAVEAMKKQIGSDDEWTKEDAGSDGVIWNHSSGRATLVVGDALQKRPKWKGKFAAVYDKDSFGALNQNLRSAFCERISEFTTKGAIVYLEVKHKDNHEEVKGMGPPFSLERDDIMEDSSYGTNFEYLENLGSVYEINIPTMKQTGHILVRK